MPADRRMVRDLEMGGVFIVPPSFRYYRRLSRARRTQARRWLPGLAHHRAVIIAFWREILVALVVVVLAVGPCRC